MTKYVLSSSVLALVLAVPAIASAQSAPSGAGCPPGSWFCAGSQDAAPPPPPPPPPSGQLDALPDPDEAPPPPPPPPRRRPRVTYAPPPPVVDYQPPPPPMVTRPEAPPPYEYIPPYPPPRAKQVTPAHEWGLNLHLEGADIGSGVNHDAGMGGGGVGLRFKPTRYFGIETDLDYVGGHGYIGDIRHETALSFNGLFFLNPRSRAQFYFLAGFGWSWANSQNDPNDPTMQSFNNQYSYFGGQAGLGLELRLTRALAFNVDVRGFVRTRTDNAASYQPEFTNSQGQSTNTSGGGLFTGGLTLYF